MTQVTTALDGSLLSPLFCKLSGELRNQIYKLTLLDDTGTLITGTSLKEPGLLRTCKIVRKEAGSIYYSEHRFTLIVHDLDSDVVMFWLSKLLAWDRLMGRQLPSRNICEHFSGRMNHWSNLRIWMLRYRAKSVPSKAWEDFEGEPDGTLVKAVLCGMFKMVRLVKMSDDVFESYLDTQRAVLGAIDAGWLDD